MKISLTDIRMKNNAKKPIVKYKVAISMEFAQIYGITSKRPYFLNSFPPYV